MISSSYSSDLDVVLVNGIQVKDTSHFLLSAYPLYVVLVNGFQVHGPSHCILSVNTGLTLGIRSELMSTLIKVTIAMLQNWICDNIFSVIRIHLLSWLTYKHIEEIYYYFFLCIIVTLFLQFLLFYSMIFCLQKNNI